MPSSRSKLTRYQVAEGRRRAAQGQTIRQIARDLEAEYQYLWNAIRGKTFAWLKKPPPIPVGTPVPDVIYTCANPNCGEQFPPGHGRLCGACTAYLWRHGRHRDPNTPHSNHYIKIPQTRLKALYRRYLAGESLESLAETTHYSAETIRRRFHEYDLPLADTNAGRRQVLTASLVRSLRHLAHKENRPVSELANQYHLNYQTCYSAVMGHTWRSAGGPLPEPESKQTPCRHCGLLSQQPICRFCRSERKGGDSISPTTA